MSLLAIGFNYNRDAYFLRAGSLWHVCIVFVEDPLWEVKATPVESEASSQNRAAAVPIHIRDRGKVPVSFFLTCSFICISWGLPPAPPCQQQPPQATYSHLWLCSWLWIRRVDRCPPRAVGWLNFWQRIIWWTLSLKQILFLFGFESGFYCVAQACLKLEIFLPQPPVSAGITEVFHHTWLKFLTMQSWLLCFMFPKGTGNEEGH